MRRGAEKFICFPRCTWTGGTVPFVLSVALLFAAGIGGCASDEEQAEDGLAGVEASSDGSVALGTETPQRYIAIEGDVESFVSYKTGTPVKNPDALPGDSDFEGVPLKDFVEKAGVSGVPESVWLLSSGDGFTVRLAWSGLDEAYMIFSEVNGWQCVAPNHPLSANAMDIDRVIVLSEDSEVGLRVVDSDEREQVIGFGGILTGGVLYGFHYEGQADVDGGDGDGGLSSRVYTREMSVRLWDVYADYEGGGFVVVTADGSQYLTDGEGRFRIEKQEIDYIETTGDEYENVAEVRLR